MREMSRGFVLFQCGPFLTISTHFQQYRGFKRVAGQKVPANTIAYFHKNFLRGKPKLLKNMNGGKAKFVSAREKRMRAQLKRDRDREQAVLLAAQQQQQALYAEQLGLGAPPGLGGTGLFGGLPAGAASSLLAGSGGNNPAAVQALLASRQMLLQRQAEEVRLAERVLAAEVAAQRQREELQLRLLQRQQQQQQQHQSRGADIRDNPLLRGGTFLGDGNPADIGSLASVEQLLAARQQAAAAGTVTAGSTLPAPSGSLMDRLLAQRLGAGVNSNSQLDASALQTARLQQELAAAKRKRGIDGDRDGERERLPSSPRQKAAFPQGAASAGQIDPELFRLYLLEQERKSREAR